MMNAPDWDEARRRWSLLWLGRHGGRPCITVKTPSGRPNSAGRAQSPEQLWLDPDYIVRAALGSFESTLYCGEAYPGHLLMAGWVVNAYGAAPRLDLDTIWCDPIKVDWDSPPTFDFDWTSHWFGRVQALHRAMVAAAGADRFAVGQGCFLPGSDLLAMVIGTEPALLAMAQRPDWARRAILKLAGNFVDVTRHFHELARGAGHEYWYGNTGWMPFWAPERFAATQSDISCMLSPEMFEQFIVPELDLAGEAFGKLWYHLDGQSAQHHLPRLLSLPYVRVIQFTPMASTPPNGPAYLDLYRRIQQAGRIVHVSVPVEHVEPLCRSLDPGLLCLETSCPSATAAAELLQAARGWTSAGRAA
jgi:hypothetical protein